MAAERLPDPYRWSLLGPTPTLTREGLLAYAREHTDDPWTRYVLVRDGDYHRVHDSALGHVFRGRSRAEVAVAFLDFVETLTPAHFKGLSPAIDLFGDLKPDAFFTDGRGPVLLVELADEPDHGAAELTSHTKPERQ